MKDKILILDFGGQYDQLIARRVREQQVYAEIKFWNQITVEEIVAAGYKGIIFTGGPNSVNDESSPHFDAALLDVGIPILGICYGDQLLAYLAGGKVSRAEYASEFGKTVLHVNPEQTSEESADCVLNLSDQRFAAADNNSASEDQISELYSVKLFQNVPAISICWMSHNDYISELPPGFYSIAKTEHCPIAAMCDPERNLYGVQFHPEVTHTEYGTQILSNFLFEICGCRAEWKMDDYMQELIRSCRQKYAGKKVLLALSGGVDSSVAAVLLHKAIGDDLTCVFVDHGLLRKDEGDFVEQTFREQFGVNLIRVDAEERFLSKLKDVTEPEEKRKIIGEEFIRVFEEEARKLGRISVLAQGTIYPDVVESGKGGACVIKSHHNVGGLPSVIEFEEVAEPLKDLFKDEVRQIGNQLCIPKELVYRQPFPGPGLAVRVIGAVTKEKLDTLREADAIFRQEMEKADCAALSNQYFAVLTDLRSVGVIGDARTYGSTVVLRAVTTDDFMTAEWTRLPYEVLESTSCRITNEVAGITRVVFDITSKPPSTVEWE